MGSTCVCTAALMVTVAGATMAGFVGSVPGVVVALGSVLSGADGPGGEESGCELAAIAAAAMASGAVGPAEAGVADGAAVVGADVGIATATGVGAVTALPACCARMTASTAAESASVVESLDFPSVDVVDDFVEDD